jgi:hypothetical protein
MRVLIYVLIRLYYSNRLKFFLYDRYKWILDNHKNIDDENHRLLMTIITL